MAQTTTTAATGIPQAAIATPPTGVPATAAPITGSPVPGTDLTAAKTVAADATTQLANVAKDAAPAAHDITSALIVDATLYVLIAFSAITWALILIKGIQHLRISYYNRGYHKKFWKAQDFQAASELPVNNGPAARVAEVGFNTLREADGGTSTHDLEHTGDRQELLDRRLRQQMQKERGALESGLSILATIGSISPFVGLFGTVWGIMGALTSISKSGSASLEVVAGPIGEALVATAVGIAVAVPAVIGYNFFIRRNKVIWAFLDDFAIDFVHLALKTSFLIRRPEAPIGTAAVRNEPPKPKKAVPSTGNIEDLSAEGAQI